MNQFLRSLLDYAAVRTVFELLGLVESQQELVQKELEALSRTYPSGKATLVVRSLGEKENSAVSLLRQVTGLNLREVLIFAQMMPAPVLTRVSAKTAVAAQRRLARIGIESEIIGVYLEDLPQAKQVEKGRNRSLLPFPVETGNYSVTLTSLGLLEGRVQEGVEKITGRTIPTVQKLQDSLPLTLLSGVDQDTAIKAQTMLQMIGAVVNIDEDTGGERLYTPDEEPDYPQGEAGPEQSGIAAQEQTGAEGQQRDQG